MAFISTTPTLAFSWPGPVELIFLLMLLAVPAALVLLVLRGKRAAAQRPAFPVIAATEADGPGTYRVVGVDKNTRADREMTIDAASRANAQVKAELDGVIVTSVEKKPNQ
jgi:hypothetical protein